MESEKQIRRKMMRTISNEDFQKKKYGIIHGFCKSTGAINYMA
jgi:hypothetical protein